jgi:hypothetical protein
MRRHSTYLDGLRQRLSSVSHSPEPFEPLDGSTQHYFERCYLPNPKAATGRGCSLSLRAVPSDAPECVAPACEASAGSSLAHDAGGRRRFLGDPTSPPLVCV